MREWMNRNPIVATGLAVVVVAACVWYVAFRGSGRRPISGDLTVYYWDLEANRTFTESTRQKAPILAPSGGQGVLAHLFTCGRCTADEWFGYLEMYAQEYHDAIQSGAFDAMDYTDRNEFEAAAVLIRSLDGEDWVPKNSVWGQEIETDVYERCPSGRPTYCRP